MRQRLRRILRRRDHAELSDEEREIHAAERERSEQAYRRAEGAIRVYVESATLYRPEPPPLPPDDSP